MKDHIYVVRNPSRLQDNIYSKQIIYNQEVMTTISKDDVEYLHKIIHEKLDNEGLWSSQEENACDLVDLLYEYFFEE
jgi:hypothetical protein